MNGAVLKRKLLSMDKSLSEVARKLNVSQQSLNQTLNVADVKTGLLENIAKIYGCPISFFFEENNEAEVTVQANSGSAASFWGGASISHNCDEIALKKEIEYLNKEIEHYKARLEEKERLIKILMEK